MGIGRETNKKTHARNAIAKGMDEWESEQDELVMSQREADYENELHGDCEETEAKQGRGRQNMTFGEMEEYCHALREQEQRNRWGRMEMDTSQEFDSFSFFSAED